MRIRRRPWKRGRKTACQLAVRSRQRAHLPSSAGAARKSPTTRGGVAAALLDALRRPEQRVPPPRQQVRARPHETSVPALQARARRRRAGRTYIVQQRTCSAPPEPLRRSRKRRTRRIARSTSAAQVTSQACAAAARCTAPAPRLRCARRVATPVAHAHAALRARCLLPFASLALPGKREREAQAVLLWRRPAAGATPATRPMCCRQPRAARGQP